MVRRASVADLEFSLGHSYQPYDGEPGADGVAWSQVKEITLPECGPAEAERFAAVLAVTTHVQVGTTVMRRRPKS